MKWISFSQRWWPIVLGLALGASVCAAVSQQAASPEKPAYASDPNNTADALARVESGDFAAVHIVMIVRAHKTEAVPALKRAFAKVQDDPALKLTLASGLLRLGARDDVYWSYLEHSAEAAISSNIPDALQYGSDGKPLAEPSPEFVTWAKEHALTIQNAAQDAVFTFPGAVLELGVSGDNRAIPLLRRALCAPNSMIVYQAARGLANLKDAESIPLIIQASQRTHTPASPQIAKWLAYFDQPEAQEAAKKLSSETIVDEIRKSREAGKSPFD